MQRSYSPKIDLVHLQNFSSLQQLKALTVLLELKIVCISFWQRFDQQATLLALIAVIDDTAAEVNTLRLVVISFVKNRFKLPISS